MKLVVSVHFLWSSGLQGILPLCDRVSFATELCPKTRELVEDFSSDVCCESRSSSRFFNSIIFHLTVHSKWQEDKLDELK